MTTWNYCNRRGQVRETDTGLLVADIPLRPNADELGTLAAAAPELLAALVEMEQNIRVLVEDGTLTDFALTHPAMVDARAAIAKATGGEGAV